MDSYSIYVSVEGKGPATIRISPALSLAEVRSVFCSAAEVSDEAKDVVLKLYRPDGVLLPIGPHIPPNTADTRYTLQVKHSKIGPLAA